MQGHLLSWAGMCSRNDESAGKRRSTRLRKGAPWLKTVLVQCAWAATRTKASYLQAQFHRLRARRGAKKALVAVAASILTAIYHMLANRTHMLANRTPHRDLGADYFNRRPPRCRPSGFWRSSRSLASRFSFSPPPPDMPRPAVRCCQRGPPGVGVVSC